MATPELFRDTATGREGYCPLCYRWWQVSDYLAGIFAHDTTLWLANMVTHYRHEHIGWDNYWSSNYFMKYLDYDTEKAKVNNRAKRVIIRKAATFMRFHGVSFNDLMELKENEDKTITVARQYLSCNEPINLDELPPMQPAEQQSLF